MQTPACQYYSSKVPAKSVQLSAPGCTECSRQSSGSRDGPRSVGSLQCKALALQPASSCRLQAFQRNLQAGRLRLQHHQTMMANQLARAQPGTESWRAATALSCHLLFNMLRPNRYSTCRQDKPESRHSGRLGARPHLGSWVCLQRCPPRALALREPQRGSCAIGRAAFLRHSGDDEVNVATWALHERSLCGLVRLCVTIEFNPFKVSTKHS
jgi:hypothetical protein